jgi:glucose/arabinose dehydrogenase
MSISAVIKSTNNFWILLLVVVSIAISYCSTSTREGEIVYKNKCAGCHGAQLQGSAASALTKEMLKYGNDRNSIMKVIRDGIPMTEMIKWDSILTGEQIGEVADYILAVRADPSTIKTDVKPLKVETKLYNLKIERLITEGLDGPWGIEFVDSNRALITGKMGELYWMVNGKLDTQKINGLPKVYGYDMYGGLMDLALDPAYSKNGWIYLAYSHNPTNSTDKNTPGMTRIVRGKVNGHQWTDEQVLFQVHDSLLVTGGMRWGSRFLFDKQGYLYFTIGDMNRGDDSQVLTRPAGKIFRINSDGSVPKDNPFYGKDHYLQAIYSWGNRNAQGLAQHPVTGVIYESEHGPQGGDELNILKKGANYGWPVVTYGIDYDGSIISKDTAKKGMEQPINYWTPSIAVSAIEFVDSRLFPRWQNNLVVTALKFEEVRRVVVDGDRVTEQEILLKGYGRVRDLKFGPDGALYLLTNTPDAVLRVTSQ